MMRRAKGRTSIQGVTYCASIIMIGVEKPGQRVYGGDIDCILF